MICVDTSCVIEALKGKESTAKVFARHKEELVTTEIVRFEVLHGVFLRKPMRQREEMAARDLFDAMEVLPFDQGCGELAARIAAHLKHDGRRIDENDIMTAAIMEKHGCSQILTQNAKHFSRVPGIKTIAC